MLIQNMDLKFSGELGLTVRETWNGVYIESLRPATTADRCGVLQAGDRLLTVDDTPIQDAITAAKMLRNNSENCRIAKLEILPQPPSVKTVKKWAQQQAQQNSSQILMEESLTVVLRPDHRGFGLVLKPSEDRISYVVSLLEASGPAEQSGVLLPGDKVIAINHKMLRDLQQTEVANLLKTSQMVNISSSFKIYINMYTNVVQKIKKSKL